MVTCLHRRQRLPLLAAAAFAVVSFIGFANVYNYSNSDSFLGLALAGQGSETGHVMLAYGVDGAAVIVTAILVLLSQSHPSVASLRISTKWWLVIAGQVVSVISSITSIIWPKFIGITASRAVHGIAEAVYMIYALVLLVELSPRKHLALGIACLTAGMTAGDSVGPVLGAIMYDASGIRGAFSLQAAINTVSMVLTVLMIPMWVFAPQQSRDQLLQAQAAAGPSLPVHRRMQSLNRSDEPEECANDNTDSDRRSRQKNFVPLPESKQTQKQDAISQQRILNTVCNLKAPVIHQAHHLCDDTCKQPNSSTAERTLTQPPAPSKSATATQALAPESSAVLCDQLKLQCKNTDPELCIAAVQPGHEDRRTSAFATDQDRANLKMIQQPVIKRLDDQIPCSSVASSTCFDSSSSSSDRVGPEPTGKLDLAAVVDTLKDPIIFSQCILLLLEQIIRNSLTVVLPAAMGTRQLVVGMVYIANAAGSVTSPFLIDAYMARKNTKCSTHILAAGTSVIMGLSCAAVVPLSKTIAALVIVLIIAGSTQAAIETLVYVHVAKRLDSLGKHSATHVSMCMCILAQTTGGGFGSLVGSALLLQAWVLQIIVAGVVCIVVGFYGTLLSVVTHRKSVHCRDAVIQAQ